MKIARYFLFLCLLMPMLGGCSSSTPAPPTLTVAVSIETSDGQEALATVEPPEEIILTFNQPLDAASIAGKVSLQIVSNGGVLMPVDPPIDVVFEEGAPDRLIIRTQNGSRLPTGEEYRLAVSSGIRSTGGLTFSRDYIRYFVTDDLPLSGFVGKLAEDRSVTIVISDLHLGDRRSMDQKYGWFRNNSTVLVNFLGYLRSRPDVKELVIAGDLFDEWVAPVEYDTFDGVGQSGFVDQIALANQTVIAAVNSIIQDGKIKVTYVPGNHDMLVESDDVRRVLPGISQCRDSGVKGLGAYTPSDFSKLVIEHGHRYDFFNAPDPLSNRTITQTDSILPPGFFVSKIAATSDMETGKVGFYREDFQTDGLLASHYFSYWAAWQLIMIKKPVKERWQQKMIATTADGYTDRYAIDDLIPYAESDNGPLDVTLYQGIVDNWPERQDQNKVAVSIPAEVAIAAGALNRMMDAQSVTQYFSNKASDKRIVVFGHTHSAYLFSALNHTGQWCIYANSGTWIDSGNPACTFVEIRPQKSDGAAVDTVTVYQYTDPDHIRKIKGAAIRN